MQYTLELDKLAKLLTMSADVARCAADARTGRRRSEIHDLADQIEDVADVLRDIVRSERVDGRCEAPGTLK